MLGVALQICSCTTYGPRSIEDQRGSYIQVLADTDKQELLSNIVRLAYMDPPVFLQVNSVTASPRIQYGAGTDFEFGGGVVDPPSTIVKPNIGYSDSPTIVYMPLLGTQFSNELLMPIGLAPVFLMLDNGFDFAVIAELLFKSIGPYTNSRKVNPEEREDFLMVAKAIAGLINSGGFHLGTSEGGISDNDSRILVDVAPGALDSQEGLILSQKLGLRSGIDRFEIRTGLRGDDQSIVISPRSLLSLLSHMSNYVAVPDEHESIVWPTPYREETKTLMRIHHSRSRPALGDPSIRYRGFWFYIDAEDITSRNTLYIIRLLFNLQAQAGSGDGLQLTLPVK